MRKAHLLSPSILVEVVSFLILLVIGSKMLNLNCGNSLSEWNQRTFFWKLLNSLLAVLQTFLRWTYHLYSSFLFVHRCICHLLPSQHENFDDISDTLTQIFKSIADNHILTSVKMEGPAWSRFERSKEKLTELLWENFTLKTIWYYQTDANLDFLFDSVTNRNKFLRKQQRFKTVKVLAPH